MILKNLRTLLICTTVQIGSVFFSSVAFSQNQSPERSTSELGISIGGLTYKGEVAPRYRFLSNRPALNIFYKRDQTSAVSLKLNLLAGFLTAKDAFYAKQDDTFARKMPLAAYRQATVNNSLLELGVGLDYNFLDYYDFRRHIRWTPIFSIGAAALVYNNKTSAQDPNVLYNSDYNDPYKTSFAVAVPIGVGFKYALSHHWNIGAEFGARLLFTDEFDNLSLQNEKVMNPNHNDWYFYNGISLSYTFYRINCPQF